MTDDPIDEQYPLPSELVLERDPPTNERDGAKDKCRLCGMDHAVYTPQARRIIEENEAAYRSGVRVQQLAERARIEKQVERMYERPAPTPEQFR